jgi:hypothetical protein
VALFIAALGLWWRSRLRGRGTAPPPEPEEEEGRRGATPPPLGEESALELDNGTLPLFTQPTPPLLFGPAGLGAARAARAGWSPEARSGAWGGGGGAASAAAAARTSAVAAAVASSVAREGTGGAPAAPFATRAPKDTARFQFVANPLRTKDRAVRGVAWQ